MAAVHLLINNQAVFDINKIEEMKKSFEMTDFIKSILYDFPNELKYILF